MYLPDENRYNGMVYNRAGKSGLKLPAVSLGLWQNFGYQGCFENMEKMVHTAFDLGITHFDIANNYGHPFNGSAEENFGRILDRGMRTYRDELCISTKAGYDMWPGPYEETALALDNAVKQGKALYVGISNYNAKQTEEISRIFRELHTPFILNQPSYSMLNRWIEDDGLDRWAEENGVGLAVFSPLYQGFLTNRYLNGIPADSRVGKGATWIGNQLDDKMIAKLNKLNGIAAERGQSLSQMALSWVLNNKAVSTVLIGASRPEQIAENAACIDRLDFSGEELSAIESVLSE